MCDTIFFKKNIMLIRRRSQFGQHIKIITYSIESHKYSLEMVDSYVYLLKIERLFLNRQTLGSRKTFQRSLRKGKIIMKT